MIKPKPLQAPVEGGFTADDFAVDEENGTVTCPCHAWRFRLADGAWADSPRVKTGCFVVRVENGEVQVQVPGETKRPY